MSRQIVYVDMDGVLVDIEGRIEEVYGTSGLEKIGELLDEDSDLFLRAKPLPGAIEGFKKLSEKYDVYILSTAPWANLDALKAKRVWVEYYLGEYAFKRLILSHNKNLMIGDYLIDDRPNNGAAEFKGELIQFNKDTLNWSDIEKYLGV
jgi:5'(3')-deoxyribonucleotidase